MAAMPMRELFEGFCCGIMRGPKDDRCRTGL
jgi:hypothetical protein